jgi:MYXO-CTERM domain-containing protein
VVPDARTGPDTAPVPAGGTTGTSTTGFSAGGNGCSLAGASTSGGFFALALLVLAGRLRKRRGS